MKKQLVIKSERGLNTVTNIIASKVRCALSIYDGVNVSVEEYVKGDIKQITVWFDYHMLCFPCIDRLREVTDAYEEKYGDCVYATIQTRPYLASDHKTWLSMPVVEITVRRMDENE